MVKPPSLLWNIPPDNEERFLLSGAAHKRWHGRAAVGAAPVSKRRIGLNRGPATAMGIVADRRSMERCIENGSGRLRGRCGGYDGVLGCAGRPSRPTDHAMRR